jgi:hypothetical protein
MSEHLACRVCEGTRRYPVFTAAGDQVAEIACPMCASSDHCIAEEDLRPVEGSSP